MLNVVRKTLLIVLGTVLAACFLVAGGIAHAAPGGNGNGNGNGGNGNGNDCSQGNNPHCTTTTQKTYPLLPTLGIRDANGNLVDGTHGLKPGDMMNIVSDGWKAGSTVAFDFFSSPIHLGDVAADDAGVVRASFAVPNVPPGQHTLRLTGLDPSGNPREVDYPILVVSPTAVLAAATNNATGGSSSGFAGFFGKTGLAHAGDIAGAGLALFAIGAVLVLAVRRARQGDATA